FTLLEGDESRVTLRAIDQQGQEIHRHVLTKGPAAADEFCAYEIEQLRDRLRQGLPIALVRGTARIDQVVRVATDFAVPVAGKVFWRPTAGWTFPEEEWKFRLEPGQLWALPLRAEVTAAGLDNPPALTIAFEPGRFRNREIDVKPFIAADG